MARGKPNRQILVEGDRRRIKIAQEDIDRAKPKQSGRCLVARAIAAKFPDASRIDVDNQTIRFTRNSERWVYLTPWQVQQYIVLFDGGDPIEPFEFSLTQSVMIQRYERSPRAKASEVARNRGARARRKLAAADSGEVELSEPDYKQLAKVITDTAAERETLKAEAQAAGEPVGHVTGRTDVPRRAAMTQRGLQGSRTSKRHYGGREMRINQDRAKRTPTALEAEAGLHLPPMPKGGYK